MALLLNVDAESVANWEKAATEPMVQHYPSIMDFLGYCPYRRVTSLGERLLTFRTHAGLSQRAMAAGLGVDPATLSRWEQGEHVLKGRYLARVQAFFADTAIEFLKSAPMYVHGLASALGSVAGRANCRERHN